jgi:CheY-like chemotaxis protein
MKDLQMPEMDGMEVIRQVKKAFPRVQVVMLTGNGSPRTEEQARRLGAYVHRAAPAGVLGKQIHVGVRPRDSHVLGYDSARSFGPQSQA